MKALIFSFILLIYFSKQSHAQWADQHLSNLISQIKINQHLETVTTATFDLGSRSFTWRTLYLKDGIFVNGYRYVENHTIGNNNYIGISGYTTTTGMRNNSLGNN